MALIVQPITAKRVEQKQWQQYGIGIDVHSQHMYATIILPDFGAGEMTLMQRSFLVTPGDVRKFGEWARKCLIDAKIDVEQPQYVIESTSTFHFVVCRTLKDFSVTVINPVIAAAFRKKTDKYDSYKLAYHSMTGVWTETGFISGEQEEMRLQLRMRKRWLSIANRTMNQIRGRLRQYGVTIGNFCNITKKDIRGIIEDYAQGRHRRPLDGRASIHSSSNHGDDLQLAGT